MPLKHELPSIRTRRNFCPASDAPIDETQHMQVFGHVEISLKRPAAPHSASDSPEKPEGTNSSTMTEGEQPTDTDEKASHQHEGDQIPRAHPTDWPLGPTDGTVLMTPTDLVASKEDNSPVLEGYGTVSCCRRFHRPSRPLPPSPARSGRSPPLKNRAGTANTTIHAHENIAPFWVQGLMISGLVLVLYLEDAPVAHTVWILACLAALAYKKQSLSFNHVGVIAMILTMGIAVRTVRPSFLAPSYYKPSRTDSRQVF